MNTNKDEKNLHFYSVKVRRRDDNKTSHILPKNFCCDYTQLNSDVRGPNTFLVDLGDKT